MKQHIKDHVPALQTLEKHAAMYAKMSKETQDPKEREGYLKREAGAKEAMAPIRAEIERLKQISVIKLAK
jgi:hypothetical protein